ncbi:MAG: hypothetical protein E7240_06645, partial [Lachnospiraceae bacterium]|nr:hypothetical protein [Lachnospiraceae bacterium]
MKKITAILVISAISIAMLSACGKTAETPENAAESETVQILDTGDPESASEESVSENDEASAPETAQETVMRTGGGTSQALSTPLELGQRFNGKYKENEIWFSFVTGPEEEVPYTITLENLTTGSDNITGYLYDKEGNQLSATRRNNDNYDGRIVHASSNGTANTGMTDTLAPDTRYYLAVYGSEKTEYSLVISTPETEGNAYSVERLREEPENYIPATNMDSAPVLSFNKKYNGRYEEGYTWVSFETGPQEEAPYTVVLENLSSDSEYLHGYLFDKYGNQVYATRRNNDNYDKRIVEAGKNGTANSATMESLLPNETYFLRLDGGPKTDYSLVLFNPAAEEPWAAYERQQPSEENFVPASNMDEAPNLTFGTVYNGHYEDGYVWTAFTTGPEEGIQYTVTLENLTVGSEWLKGYLFDKFGNQVYATQRNNDNYDKRIVEAGQDGTANSAMMDTLLPNETYFIRLEGGSKADYLLTVSSAIPQTTQNTMGTGVPPVSGPGNAGNESSAEIPAGEAPDPDGTIVPGTSQSYAIKLPIGTKVFGRYEQGYAWTAFTTGSIPETEYWITVVNCTVGSNTLKGYLFDRYGNQIYATKRLNDNYDKRFIEAEWDGTANSGMINTLEPNTTYYLRLQGDGRTDYSLLISCPSAQAAAGYATSSSITESRGEVGPEESFVTGTNQNDATILRKNASYHGSYEEGYVWTAFTTDGEEGAEYTVTLENLTVGSETLKGYLFDCFGNQVYATKRNNDNYDKRIVEAKQDGTANTAMFNELKPNETYYLRLEGGSKADYILTLGRKETQQTVNTIEQVEEKVFEVPFEIN